MRHEKPDPAPTTDQLRAATDSGAAHDKVAFPDPAAAPLGTDAEAAGASPAAGELRQAFTAEVTERQTRKPAITAGALPLVLGFLLLILISALITALILA